MKKALLISESTVYKDGNGKIVARGGGEVYMHNLAKLLLKLGVEPTVFGIKEFGEQNSEKYIDGILYKRCEVRSRKSFSLFKYLFAGIRESKKYDFVFMNQFVPHLILPFIKRKKKIAIIHDVYKEEGLGFWINQYGFFTGFIGWLVEKFQLFFDKKYSDVIITVSEESKRKIISALGSKIARKIIVSPSIVYKRDDLIGTKKENFILFIGRFVDYKHPEHVLHVLKKLKSFEGKFKAVFVAPRIVKKTLRFFEKTMKDLGIGNGDVFILQNCGNDDVAKLIAKAKLLVHPSCVEGQGIIMLEALSLGTPIIAYNLPAYEGMLLDGENCELVKKDDFGKLADSALKILNNYSKYQDNCYISLEEFSEEKALEILKGIIE
jgi:glycosyltransferase involved in cell wall biosynthesis